MSVFGAIRNFFYESAPQLAAEPAVDAPPAKPRGSDGVVAWGGWIQSGESNSKLLPPQKWTTYANTINSAVVATGVRYFGNLLAASEWHAEPNKAGGAGADRGAEIVREGLFEADTSKTWSSIVRKAAVGYRLNGFSLHATAMARRARDGLLVYTDIAHRPQHTIEQWLRDDASEPWRAVLQRTPEGKTYEIPLSECLYCDDDLLTDSPEGVGLLRHIVQPTERLTRYQTLEWLAFEGGMAGFPVARAPIEEIEASCGAQSDDEKAAIVAASTATLRAAVEQRVKQPDKLQWLMLDSAVYKGLDENKISTIKKWAIEIVKGELQGIDNLHEAIKRLQFEIARVLGVEFALVGAEGGSYSMHEDKTSMFATNLSVTLSEIAKFATKQLARRLVALNGLDPETCTPTLVAEPISTDKVLDASKALVNIALAKLHPLDPARPVFRKRMRLPPETPEMLPDLLEAWKAANSKPPASLDPEDDDEDEKEAA